MCKTVFNIDSPHFKTQYLFNALLYMCVEYSVCVCRLQRLRMQAELKLI